MHPLVLMVIVAAGIVISGAVAWNKFRDEVVARDQFAVTLERIVVPPTPGGIPEDWLHTAFQDSQLAELSLLDVDATDKVVAMLAGQPWIRGVRRIEKLRDRFVADIEYREAIAMVEIGEGRLVPIDGEAVILDGQFFSPEQATNCMRISVPLPPGSPAIIGQPWPDARIVGCARIAELLRTHWQRVGLLRVVNRESPRVAKHRLEVIGSFELFTRNDVPILWGSAPGFEKPGEASAEQKLAALLKFTEDMGSFERIPIGYSLDIRSGTVSQGRIAQ